MHLLAADARVESFRGWNLGESLTASIPQSEIKPTGDTVNIPKHPDPTMTLPLSFDEIDMKSEFGCLLLKAR